MLAPALARAQVQGKATIQGTVSDPSGATLPGVTVTATSPQLLVPSLTVVTSADGGYRFTDVPIGTYSLRYELSGFRTLLREGIILTVGFVARIDMALSLGALEESVTVSGASPLVDVTSTTPVQSFSQETLAILPTTRQQYSILSMTPGITMTGNIDVGGSQLGTQLGYKNYGTTGQPTPQIEGINFRQDANLAGIFLDYYAFQEFQVKAAGMDAEIGLPGSAWSGIVKSGGNAFHGDVIGAYQPKQFSKNNLDSFLTSHGVTGVGNQLQYLYDAFGDLGGRVIKDKLWFYGAWHNQSRSQHVANYSDASVLGANGLQGNEVSPIDDHPITNQTLKLSYQATPKYKFVYFVQRNTKNLVSETAQSQQTAPFSPLQSSDNLLYEPVQTKIELQGMPTSSLVFDLQLGYNTLDAHRTSQPGQDVAGNPSQLDQFTQWRHGPYLIGEQDFWRKRFQPSGSLTFVPDRSFGGKHSLKTGFFVDLFRGGTPQQGKCNSPGSSGEPYCSGNYVLLFNRINNRPFQPFQIQVYNNPTDGLNERYQEVSAYVKDNWQVNPRLTANLGVRFERYHAYVVPANQPAGQFVSAGSFPGVDVLTWMAAAPRLGASYDVTGSGKTVVKSSWGWYNHTMGDTAFATTFDKAATTVTTYTWNGPCLATQYTTCDYVPGSVDLSRTSPAFVTTTSPGSAILNPDLKQPRTYEFTAGLEREVMANLALRAYYVYRRQDNLFALVNPARPFSAYSVPVTLVDPGPDGRVGSSDDGGPITLSDYSSAFAGAAFTKSQYQNTPDANHNAYHTLELTMNKRLSGRWGLLASVTALKNHRWLISSGDSGVAQSPNDLLFPIDETWERDAKFQFIYRLPYGLTVAAVDQIQEGVGLQRTFLFTGLPQLKSLTARLEPFGALRLPTTQLISFSASRDFALPAGRKVNLKLDVYNILNSNTATSINSASGPSYGNVTSYFPGAVARLGIEYRF